MSKKLSKSEAQRIIKKFCKPPYDPDEAKIKEAMWVILQENGGKDFKWEEAEEEEKQKTTENKPGAGSLAKEASQTASSAGGGLLEGAGQYVGQVVSNVQGLGAAGTLALGSATYFQADTVVDSTEEVTAIVREIEVDYGQTFANYFVENTAYFIESIPVIEKIPVVNTALASASESLLEVADEMETVEEKQERIETEEAAEQAEAEAEAEAEAAEQAETEAERQAAREEAKQEREAKREEREAKREEESEEAQSEESEPEDSEDSEESQESEDS